MLLFCVIWEKGISGYSGAGSNETRPYILHGIAPPFPNPWHFKSLITDAVWNVQSPWAEGAIIGAQSHHNAVVASYSQCCVTA